MDVLGPRLDFGSYWVQSMDCFLIYLGFGEAVMVSYCNMSARLRIVPFSWFVLWPCGGTVV